MSLDAEDPTPTYWVLINIEDTDNPELTIDKDYVDAFLEEVGEFAQVTAFKRRNNKFREVRA